MNHSRLATLGLVFLLGGASRGAAVEPPDVLALVDPFVGTGGHGHTYPGATVPFGMVQAPAVDDGREHALTVTCGTMVDSCSGGSRR